MSIKIRLLISYIAMLIIPVVLTIIAAILIGVIYLGVFTNTHGLNLGHDFIKDNMEKGTKAFEEVIFATSAHPDKLEDISYIKKIDEGLSSFGSGLAVEKNNRIIYISKMLNNEYMISRIKSLTWERDNTANIHGEGKIYTIRKYDIVFSDKKPGRVMLVANISPVKQFVTQYFSTLLIAMVVILILTNVLLTFFVSRSIIKPLGYLKNAANEIKNGNLNHEISYKSKDEIGELAGAFEEMRSKLKESIELEQQYEVNRKELISNISHDLKTPITAVKGYVEGIRDGVADTPEKMDKYIRTIYTKTTEIDRLIDELFLYSKLDLKKLPFNFERVDIKGYLEDCTDELSFDFEDKGIELSFNTDCAGKLFVIGDREKLKRVIMNIVGNSVKYMNNKDGKIEITLSDEEKNAVIRIRDNGQGIDEKDLPYIFDRFYRTDPARNTSTGGSGLGLAIVKHIVEEHGGRIWAESRLGEGTSVIFTLKKVEEESERV